MTGAVANSNSDDHDNEEEEEGSPVHGTPQAHDDTKGAEEKLGERNGIARRGGRSANVNMQYNP